MTREEIFALLDQYSECELYEELYQNKPAAFERPIRSWEEFCARFLRGRGTEKIRPPKEAPTQIADFLTEEEYFAGQEQGDVSVVVNARYCPAFLHKLEFIKVIYVLRGQCGFFYKEKCIEMTAGNVCIVAPGVEQAVFSCRNEDIVLNLLLRRSTFTEAFPEFLESGEGGAIAAFFWKMIRSRPGGEVMLFDGKPQPLLEESVLELYEEAALQPVKSGLVMRSMMMAIFAYILRWDEQEVVNLGEGRKEKTRYPLPDYLSYMRQNLKNVTLPSMAAAFYVSEGYLSRYIKKETGDTFRHLLQKMRMKKAAELLINTECNMEKIVELIGYTDQSIFFRNFKAEYGMTPVTYRKKKGRTNFLEPQS